MFTKLKVDGFKCFDKLEIPLKNLNLFTGANSSGKSTAIQAMLLLAQQAEQGKNALNGKYIRLGLFQDIKNSIINPKAIYLEMDETKGDTEKKVCVSITADGAAVLRNEDIFPGKDLVYLSAERIGAEDVYRQNLTDEFRIGIRGEYAFDYLSQERMNRLREERFINPDMGVNLGNQVDYWLDYIMGYSVTAERISGTEVVKVSYRRTEGGAKDIKPQHIGTGVSYVATLIISALSCEKDSLFIVENPEIHLHPRAQSRLLEFFCFLAARGLQIVVETHSDHIFNGVRKSIKAGMVSREDTGVYFFKQDQEFLSSAVRIQIDENGVIQNHEEGLFDQFDEDLDELLGL